MTAGVLYLRQRREFIRRKVFAPIEAALRLGLAASRERILPPRRNVNGTAAAIEKQPSFQARKPSDPLAEGHLQKDNRGDKTAIELFLAGILGWEAGMRRILV
jgi:hypothetical protein